MTPPGSPIYSYRALVFQVGSDTRRTGSESTVWWQHRLKTKSDQPNNQSAEGITHCSCIKAAFVAGWGIAVQPHAKALKEGLESASLLFSRAGL